VTCLDCPLRLRHANSVTGLGCSLVDLRPLCVRLRTLGAVCSPTPNAVAWRYTRFR